MNQNNHNEMRYSRLTAEAILNSGFVGLAIASGAVFVLGAIFWFIGVESLALVIGLLAGLLVALTAGIGAIFYFAKFRPTIQKNARRIDSMGLEERTVTMLEYGNDDSIIARFQREDAQAALSKIKNENIKMQVEEPCWIAAVICVPLMLAMSVLAILCALGLIPSGLGLVDAAIKDEPPIYLDVFYMAEDGGYIEGVTEQLVLFGENASPVVAIPEEGYSFEGWDDGYKKPTRTDEAVDHPLTLTAIFLPIEEDSEDPGDDAEHGDDGEAPGEEEGENGENPGEHPGDEESDDPSDSGSGKYNKVNQIIDGETYYKEFLEEYKEQIMDLLKKNIDTLTEEERAIIEAYINIV